MMSSKIRLLDEHVINQIAAGEVIENPASVVKELAENSIDAGARDICVEIQTGGRQLIRISDNGCGMNEEEAKLCLQRHATSKIQDLDDIYSTLTMGFRGEAIPSIASISKFTLFTAVQGSELGTLVMVEGGHFLKCSPVVKSPGTTIEVKQLFFNVPVRKKFQRSPQHDANEILKAMTTLALAHPEIRFELIHNHKQIMTTGASVNTTIFAEMLGERIPKVLSPEYFTGMCPLQHTEKDYRLIGWIGLPTFTRHNRSGQHLFINRRAVISPMVSHTIREAYGHALPTQRYPVFVLHMEVPPSTID